MYFAERVLFGCFFLIEAGPDAEVVEAGVGPEGLLRARSLAVSIAGTSDAVRSEAPESKRPCSSLPACLSASGAISPPPVSGTVSNTQTTESALTNVILRNVRVH